jgi:dTDP-glucose 4,6-dehydratase
MIPTFIGQALAGEPLPVTGDGEQTRSLCHVDDTALGLLALPGGDHSGPVNIGNPLELSVRRLAEEVCVITGADSPIRFIEAAVDDSRQRCPDITVGGRELGWQPKVSLREGLRRTVDWFAGSADAGSGTGLSLSGTVGHR